jgi:excisionase family DNA binding protein
MDGLILIQQSQLIQLLSDTVSKAFTAHFSKANHNDDTDKSTEVLTRRQTCELLNISLQTLDNWTREGRFKKYRTGRTVRYKKKEVLAAFKTFHKHQRGEAMTL